MSCQPDDILSNEAFPLFRRLRGWSYVLVVGLEFEEPDSDFFEKIATVYLLAAGRPAVSEAEAQGLPDDLAKLMPTDNPPSKVYLTTLIGVHLAAMFVPFLVFSVKWWLMPKEVDAYYSAWHQAFAGDPEARMMLSVEDKVRRGREPW